VADNDGSIFARERLRANERQRDRDLFSGGARRHRIFGVVAAFLILR
jgi:hypothetical protein